MKNKENRTVPASYGIDLSALLYLAQMRRDHSNVYRFSMTLKEPVCPELLQKAADRVYSRFPTIFAGIRPTMFSYSVVPADTAPGIRKDPGLLKTMDLQEVKQCGYRIYYDGCEISIEVFHAMTDGFGAIASFRTLTAEYLRLRYGISSPEQQSMLEQGEPDWQEELRDSYLDHAKEKPYSLPNRHAYQLMGKDRDWQVKTSVAHFSTAELQKAAKRSGVSMTAMLSGILAEAIMDLQNKQGNKRHKPVRIMVPVDLRKRFPSKTLRNFILYALPTLEVQERDLPRRERLRRFQEQIRLQTEKAQLEPQISRNVRLQCNVLFSVVPRALKCLLLRIVYCFFGESNSSITMTNLGPVFLSEEMKQYVNHIDVHLTPRRQSPYNCGLISCGDTTSISITRFGALPELEPLFFGKLQSLLA